MKTCASCKFYERTAEGVSYYGDDHAADPIESNHRPCLRIRHGNEFVGETQLELVKDEPAIVIDGENYKAVLYVLPSFGCCLHEYRV